MNREILDTIDKSNLPIEDKSDLKSCTDRAELSIAMSEQLFKNRAHSKKPNYEEHAKLSHTLTDNKFTKNVLMIIKKM